MLFDVDIDVREGEIVALLGTNGAGKSTLLKSISGIVEADRGAIILDGRDITHAPPNEIAELGIVQVPGGSGVFGGLTVAENLELAGWTARRDPAGVAAATAEVLELFPILAERSRLAAADLSGGQQQMLALGMAFVSRPRVLLIDELSLGLAPLIVGQLLPIIQRLAAAGVAVVLVEQSVNVALTVAERAYFMERGTIRFSGPTADLLARPDMLRSVFLQRASAGAAPPNEQPGRRRLRTAARRRGRWRWPSTGSCDGSAASAPSTAPRSTSTSARSSGMIGPNGAGKTTIFDLVSGFLPLDAGRIVLAGRDVTHMSAAGRAEAGLGRSFQDALLFPDMTVEETLKVALERWVGTRSVLAAAMRLPWVVDDEDRSAARGERAPRADGPRAVPHQLRARAVDRDASHPRPRLPDRPPADRHPPRRAVVGDRPARGRSAGAGARPAA